MFRVLPRSVWDMSILYKVDLLGEGFAAGSEMVFVGIPLKYIRDMCSNTWGRRQFMRRKSSVVGRTYSAPCAPKRQVILHHNHSLADDGHDASRRVPDHAVLERIEDIRYWTLCNVPIPKMFDMLARDSGTFKKRGVLGRITKRKVGGITVM